MPLTTYGQTAMLQLLSGQLVKPANWYIGLHTATPVATGNEVAGTGYARQTVTLQTPVGVPNSQVNSGAVTFTAGGANWSSYAIAYAGLWDAVSAGNCWWSEAVSTLADGLIASQISVNSGGSGYISGDVGKQPTATVPLTTPALSGFSLPSNLAVSINIVAVAGGQVQSVALQATAKLAGKLPGVGPYTTTGGGATGSGLTVDIVWRPTGGVTYTLNNGDTLTISALALALLLV